MQEKIALGERSAHSVQGARVRCDVSGEVPTGRNPTNNWILFLTWKRCRLASGGQFPHKSGKNLCDVIVFLAEDLWTDGPAGRQEETS